jgi:hypothetical protein
MLVVIFGTFCSDMDTPFTRDEEQEDLVQRMIYDNARGPEPEGDVDDDFTSQFLNDSGDGVESEERRDDEVPLPNTDKVYRDHICIY